MQGVEKMSKRAYIFYLLVLIIGFGIAYVSGIRFGTNNNVNKYTENKSINTNSLTDENSEVEGYWIIAVDNKLNVYKKDKKTIMAETDIDISDFSLKEKTRYKTEFITKTQRSCLSILSQIPADTTMPNI